MTIPDFLLRLRMLDKRGLSARDVIILYYVMLHPGSNGADVSHALGLENRSSIQLNLKRLFEAKFIEDRRTEFTKRVSCRLYALPAGVAFWGEVKP